MKYWEIIADNLKKARFSVDWVSALDDCGRTVWIVDAHRDGKRFLVRADEKLFCCCAAAASCFATIDGEPQLSLQSEKQCVAKFS